MKKVLFIAASLFLLNCSSDDENKNQDGEWISPRQCTELALQNPRCDLDPNCERQSPESIEEVTVIYEEHGCVIRKTACIDENVRDDDIKCARELED